MKHHLSALGSPDVRQRYNHNGQNRKKHRKAQCVDGLFEVTRKCADGLFEVTRKLCKTQPLPQPLSKTNHAALDLSSGVLGDHSAHVPTLGSAHMEGLMDMNP